VREGKVQLTDGYVVIRDGELFIIGCLINPLKTASSHVRPDSVRTKKLLMKKDEIRRLIGKVEQKGYTLVPLNLHWKNGKVKCEIALAKGKAEHDKRDTIKEREGKREVERALKQRSRRSVGGLGGAITQLAGPEQVLEQPGQQGQGADQNMHRVHPGRTEPINP